MCKLFKVSLLSTLVVVFLQGNTLDKARAYYHQGLYTQAFPLFETLAKEGNKESKYKLALMYEKGQGVDENITKAMRYYTGNLFTNFRLWHRISEDDKISPADFDGDDNPDIEEYLGYGDISLSEIGLPHQSD